MTWRPDELPPELRPIDLAEPPDDVDLVGQLEDRSIALSTISTDAAPPMLIDRLDPIGHTILYGTGGVGKGALACWWIVQLVRAGYRVLVLDYERHPEEWSRRVASLDRGVHDSDLVRYLSPLEPITQCAPEVAYTCERHELDVVVVDSAVMAVGVMDPAKPEAAAAYAGALLAVARPTLTLAHVTKLDDARYPFGSIFWHNLARMTWSLTGDNGEIILKHRKHNNYQSLGSFALKVTWDDGRLREVWERGYNASIESRVLEAMENAGDDKGLTIDDLLAALNDDEHKPVSRATLRKTLNDRAVKAGRVRLSDERYYRA